MSIAALQAPAAKAGAIPTDRLGGYQGKRALDLLAAALLLALTAPLMLPIWLLLWAETGQGFARRLRIGRGGRHIRCLVFHVERRGAMLAGPVALWVRRAGLSGLPLLWSVLRGEMSLVGPRPATRADLARYGLAQSGYLAMRPGLTGLADARDGGRFCDRVHDDLRYGRIASPRVDLGLIAAALMRRWRSGRPQPDLALLSGRVPLIVSSHSGSCRAGRHPSAGPCAAAGGRAANRPGADRAGN
ncbi:lipopolysaccharide/colanic/teichoic acid biosynthesis glycosyltransferase [Rhodovulum sulfidophilum]|uniref:sugar transferase n=1 Tax=Rhodovulum sulfidophilum TaxID=35806 RepID=UPI0009BD2E5C|nr:sugar transferase [Rhodovulum sulfidophilum]MCW2302283.1 lipopolysaccharide/colanic/teichoic acid biosynthesis glycosyltransferase [Rhodovulum sulfidophilum]